MIIPIDLNQSTIIRDKENHFKHATLISVKLMSIVALLKKIRIKNTMMVRPCHIILVDKCIKKCVAYSIALLLSLHYYLTILT
jgi:hypothetical protein